MRPNAKFGVNMAAALARIWRTNHADMIGGAFHIAKYQRHNTTISQRRDGLGMHMAAG